MRQFNRWLILLLTLVTHQSLAAGGKIDYTHMAFSYKDESIRKLRNQGSRCVSDLQADSALFFYSLASTLYRPELHASDREDCVISTINTGYVWLFMFNNAEQAYPWIERGIELCHKEGLGQYLPIASSYLAQIHYTYGDIDKALDLYANAVKGSLEGKIWWSLVMSYTDMLTLAWETGRLSEVRPYMKLFEKVEFPVGTRLSDYAHDIHEGMKAWLVQDYASARLHFEKALLDNDAESGREHGEMQTMLYVADAALRSGNSTQALDMLHKAETLMLRHGFWDLSKILYNKLEETYYAMGDSDAAVKSHYRNLEIRDSIFNAGKYGKIKDLEVSHTISNLDSALNTAISEREQMRKRALLFGMAAIIIGALCILAAIKNRKLQMANRELYLRNQEILTSREIPVPLIPETGIRQEESTHDDTYLPFPHDLTVKITGVIETAPEVFDPDFSIDTLAQMVGSLPRYVSKAINASSGGDFRTLLAKRRVHEACHLLTNEAREGRLTVGAIAGQVGYRSRTHFSKVFKDLTGLSPTEYLRQAKKVDSSKD